MKRTLKYFIFYLMVVSANIYAQQNLIYNGDFELYDTCPVNVSSPLTNQIKHCLGWDHPTYGTSDYFNSCNNSINGQVGVPNNVVGWQQAKNGNGYTGFLAFYISGGGCYSGVFWWEYVQGKLNTPLIKNHIYNISFYFSMAEVSNIAIKNIGFYFDANPISDCSPAPLNLQPQITVSNINYWKDTSNWFLVSGSFKAEGGEKYIVIGNFQDSTTTDTLNLAPHSPFDPISYYYVDNGTINDLTPAQSDLPNFFTPNGDGVNDTFGFENIEISLLEIYNRWGKKIFETKNQSGFWDGRTISGELSADGVYYFILKGKTSENNEIEKHGYIQLIK